MSSRSTRRPAGSAGSTASARSRPGSASSSSSPAWSAPTASPPRAGCGPLGRGRLRRPRARPGSPRPGRSTTPRRPPARPVPPAGRLWAAGRPSRSRSASTTSTPPGSPGRRGRPLDPPPRLPLGLARPAVDPPADRAPGPCPDRGRPARDARRPRHHLPPAADDPPLRRPGPPPPPGRADARHPARRRVGDGPVVPTRRDAQPRTRLPAVLDLTAPALVVRDRAGPPRSGPIGWLVQVDNKAVAIVRLVFDPRHQRGPGLGRDRRPDRDRRQAGPVPAQGVPRPGPRPPGQRPRRARRRPPVRRRRRLGRPHPARDRPGRAHLRRAPPPDPD